MVCAVCSSGIDHCHGTLVVHVDGGFAECTDERCTDLDQPRHASVIDCASVSGGCGCALPVGLDTAPEFTAPEFIVSDFLGPEFAEQLQQVS